jgi:hypothetical protein
MRIEFINSRGPCHQQDVRMRDDSVRITDKCGNRGQSSPPYKRSLLSCRAESMRRVPGREPECPRATSGNWVATLLIVA